MAVKNIIDLFEKIDWAEGMSSAVVNEDMYLIEEYDVPDDLKDAWQEMAACVRVVHDLLDEYYTEYDNNKEF